MISKIFWRMICALSQKKNDSFELPRGIELFEQDDLPYNEPIVNEGMIHLFDENPDEHPSDENLSDGNPSDENPSDDNVRSDENTSDENQTRI
jgi:DNA-directed RNA polymerase delta subunit